MKLKYIGLAIGIVVLCGAIPPWIASSTTGGEKREFYIKARQYAYEPPRIVVNRGDEVHIRLVSMDVVHGFYLEGYDINALIEPGTPVEGKSPPFKMNHPSEGKEFSLVEEIVFTANRPGKFRYRCSHTCGTLHPFMQGELIVRPNYPYLAGVGATGGIVIAAFVISFLGSRRRGPVPGAAPAEAA
ncbi:MAG: hypothetical protein QGD94_07580 [Planctomycetia bacterium]|nr:hypothetical protein [Planctomycetia bacterium]